MLITDLLKQNWLKNFRNQSFYRGLAVKILMGFMGLYASVVLFILGFFLNEKLSDVSATLKPLEVFNGAMLYIMLASIMIRFLMMSLNTLNLQTYQSLPIKRSTLVHFILTKSVLGLGNYILLIAIIPFALRGVAKYNYDYPSAGVAVQFVVNFIFIIWFDVLVANFLKRKFGSSLIALFVFIGIASGLAALEYFKIFSIFNISLRIFNILTQNPLGLLISIAAVIAAYGLNLWFFSQNYYPEKFDGKINKGNSTVTKSFTFLEKYGTAGELISLQIKLIFRHKRTKALVYMSVLFLFYEIIFLKNPIYKDSPAWLFFAAIFTTGILMIMYGQWVMSWESSYFDTILTKNIPTKTYMRANYYLLLAFNTISFILTTPYFFFYGKEVVFQHLAAYLYNTGVNISLFLIFSSFNTKRVDLNARSSFNYQGTTYKSFLIILPILFFPMIVMGIASAFNHAHIGLIIMGSVGAIGFIFREKLINISVKLLNKRKYIISQGFREKE